MTRPICSVVLATYNRAHLLKRSLQCYQNQDFDNSRFELIIIDDHSTDDTVGLVMDWAHDTKIKTTIVTPCPKTDVWRDCGAILNSGIRAALGDHILLTHPEVMPGKRSVKKCVERLALYENSLYVSCKVYYMGRRDQTLIDTVPWEVEGAEAIRGIEGFYDEDENGNPDYRHNVTDLVATPGFRIQTWDSWVFGGCSRETWKRLGGMLETQKWGSVDVAFMQRRQTLGIPNHTCPDGDTIVVHQNHDSPSDTKTPREAGPWQRELRGIELNNPNKLKYPAVDNLGWS